MLKIYISILFVSVVLFISGCGAGGELSGLNQNEYKIVKERQEFEKNQNAMMTFEVQNDTNDMLTMLLDAHVKIMYKINIDAVSKVASVSLIESKNLNLNKILIPTKDYYYDSVNESLYLAVDIPYIYMLENELSLDVNIIGSRGIGKKSTAFSKNIKINFQTQPMKANGQEYMSFEFEDGILSKDVDPFILCMIKMEVESANIDRFSQGYIHKYKSVLGVD